MEAATTKVIREVREQKEDSKVTKGAGTITGKVTKAAQEEEKADTQEAKEVTKDGPKEERIRAVTQEAKPQVKQDRDSFPTVRDPAINAEAKAT